jgi:hypothetical protein
VLFGTKKGTIFSPESGTMPCCHAVVCAKSVLPDMGHDFALPERDDAESLLFTR